MKRIVYIVVIAFVVATFFILENKMKDSGNNIIKGKDESIEEKRAFFFSYIEFQDYFDNKNEVQIKEKISEVLNNMEGNKFNMLILHVRPFSDSIYPNSVYPSSYTITGKEGEKLPFDVLDYFISESHKRKIEVHAWINPYRIRNTTDVSKISQSNPCYKWFGSSKVKIIEGKGIFYNPSVKDVEDLIVSGVEEIVKKYDVDGIHFDDYFYPDDTIDQSNYEEYKTSGGNLDLKNYRLNIVSSMVKRVYQTIKDINPKVMFGISPEGNIDNNYTSNYADTKKWISEKGYIDYIMPQIYFGFENGSRPFIDTVEMWNDLITEPTIKLLPALAFYKVGVTDTYAASGSMEWLKNDDIIKKQIVKSRMLSKYQGFSLFRYGSFYDDDLVTETTFNEKKNVLEVIK